MASAAPFFVNDKIKEHVKSKSMNTDPTNNNNPKLSLWMEQVKATAESAADFIRAELYKVKKEQIITKELNSLVSYVDKTAEDIIVKQLSEIIPEAGFITEEDTVDQTDREYVWIIDPLDGTSNFLHKIPHFAVSIALRHGDDTVLGVVYDVMRSECFSAIRGRGAYMNEHKITVSPVTSLSNAMMATGFPYASSYDFKPLVDTLQYWFQHARGIRRFGAAALDLCFVAAGRIDAYYESKLHIWDIAAGVIIVQEAGGIVSDYFGGDTYKEGTQIVATNANLHDKVISVLSENFTKESV